MKIRLMSAFIMLMGMIQGYGIPTIGNNPNTNAPSGDRGYKTQGKWGSCIGIPVKKRFFLAAKHLNDVSIGSMITVGGVSYKTISKIDHPTLDLTVWKVNTDFPTDVRAILCTNTNLTGKEVTIFGRGPMRGAPIVRQCNPLTIENFKTGTCDEFDVTGSSLGTRFIIQCSTNLCDWSSLPTVYVADGSGSNHVILPPSSCAQMYYRTMIVNSTIGYTFADYNGIITWGINTIEGKMFYDNGTYSWYCNFDRNGGDNECFTAPGDSSGGVFVFDGGQWKLAALNWNSIHGTFYLDGNWFLGSMMDLTGVNWGGWVYPANQQEIPAISNHTPIPVDWVNSVTGGQ